MVAGTRTALDARGSQAHYVGLCSFLQAYAGHLRFATADAAGSQEDEGGVTVAFSITARLRNGRYDAGTAVATACGRRTRPAWGIGLLRRPPEHDQSPSAPPMPAPRAMPKPGHPGRSNQPRP
jgi:hypothetical protein